MKRREEGELKRMGTRPGHKGAAIAACVLALAMALPAAAATTSASKTTASAKTSVKSGLKEESGKLYYYVKGKKIRNQWKSVKVKSKTCRYYFGKTGAAYTAPVPANNSYNIKVYTIAKKKYGFDTDGHMVTGLQLLQKLNEQGRIKSVSLYFFNSKGVFQETKTKKIRKLLKQGTKQASFLNDLKKLAGKPKKVKNYKDTCSDAVDPAQMSEWHDVSVFYEHFEIVMVHHKTTGEYYLDYYMPKL